MSSEKRRRRHFSADEKVAILKRHLVDKVAVSDLCDELDLQPRVFYRWQQEFFERGRLRSPRTASEKARTWPVESSNLRAN